jgi:hypothetical protein
MSESDRTCRVCLQRARTLKKFNEKMLKFQIFECFQQITSIEIQGSGIQYNKLCKKCYERLKDAVEFREEALKNDGKYRSLLAKEGE